MLASNESIGFAGARKGTGKVRLFSASVIVLALCRIEKIFLILKFYQSLVSGAFAPNCSPSIFKGLPGHDLADLSWRMPFRIALRLLAWRQGTCERPGQAIETSPAIFTTRVGDVVAILAKRLAAESR